MADTERKQQNGTGKRGRPAGSTGNKGGNRKRKSAPEGKTKPAKEEYYQEEDMGFMRAEIVIICSFAVAILLFLSNFRLCGVVGDLLRGFQLGVFGILGYLVPLLLFIGTCFYLSNRGNLYATIKLAASVGTLITLCGLLQLMFGTELTEGSWVQYFTISSANGAGGGWLGGVLVSLLSMILGKAGAFLVFLVSLILCLVCITGKSFVSFVKKGGDRAYRYAREDMDRRRELHTQRVEERRRQKEEEAVRGVDLSVTTLMPHNSPVEKEKRRLMAQEKEQGLNEEKSQVIHEEKPQTVPEEVPPAVSPADQFVGQIQRPDGYAEEEKESDPAGLAQELEEQLLNQPQEDSQEEEEPEYETIHIVRESRTLEEMEMGGRAAPVSFEEDLIEDPQPAPSPVLPLKREAEPVKQNVNEKISPYQPLDRTRRIQTVSPAAQEYVEMPEEEEIPISLHSEDVREEAPDEEVIETGYTEEWIDAEPDFEPEADQEDTPPWKEPAPSAGPDTLVVAEAEKRVVTASGKVIETDTELLRKKIEQKREEKKDEGEILLPPKEEKPVKKQYVFPPLDLLKKGSRNANSFSEDEYKATAIKLQQTLKNFGVGVTVTNISCGPSVTRYELLPEQGVKVSKIVSLTDDIKLSLAAADIRIEAPIPGKSAVGIEVPNKENNIVYLRDLLEAESFRTHKSRLAFAVGKDIGGQVVVTDIGKMPHLLIAGATGSGKSVCINTLIMSIIFKADPEDVKLIMVDPKVVELSVYNGIPHLLIPVVTDPKKASGALNWAVAEMTDRYKKFAECNVRDLKGYNERVSRLTDVPEDQRPSKLPQIVIIIDELADLMMVAPGEVEDSICRLAQLARAAGIHLVIATQRPSVNVITGLIKANVPSRIAFAVSSGVDSRTIIDMNGAEKLLGKGDMLFYPAGFPKPQRVQGAFVSDDEVGRVVEFLTDQGLTAQYNEEVVSKVTAPSFDGGGSGGGRDEYFVQAGKFIIEKDKASIGMLQRMFKIGFNRAARIMDQLAEAGVVGEEEGTKPRKILMSPEEFEEMLEQGY